MTIIQVKIGQAGAELREQELKKQELKKQELRSEQVHAGSIAGVAFRLRTPEEAHTCVLLPNAT